VVINAASSTITHALRQANKLDWIGYAAISIQQATTFYFFFPSYLLERLKEPKM